MEVILKSFGYLGLMACRFEAEMGQANDFSRINLYFLY